MVTLPAEAHIEEDYLEEDDGDYEEEKEEEEEDEDEEDDDDDDDDDNDDIQGTKMELRTSRPGSH